MGMTIDTSDNTSIVHHAPLSPIRSDMSLKDVEASLSPGKPLTTVTSLPESVRLLLINRLNLYLTQLISGNPALPMITGNEIIKAMIVEEVIQQTHSSLSTVLEIMLKSRREFDVFFTSSSSENKKESIITQEYLEENPILATQLAEQVDELFQYSQGK
jgi:hypothetical protein